MRALVDHRHGSIDSVGLDRLLSDNDEVYSKFGLDRLYRNRMTRGHKCRLSSYTCDSVCVDVYISIVFKTNLRIQFNIQHFCGQIQCANVVEPKKKFQ